VPGEKSDENQNEQMSKLKVQMNVKWGRLIVQVELLFGWLKGIWAIGRWEEPKSPETPL